MRSSVYGRVAVLGFLKLFLEKKRCVDFFLQKHLPNLETCVRTMIFYVPKFCFDCYKIGFHSFKYLAIFDTTSHVANLLFLLNLATLLYGVFAMDECVQHGHSPH